MGGLWLLIVGAGLTGYYIDIFAAGGKIDGVITDAAFYI